VRVVRGGRIPELRSRIRTARSSSPPTSTTSYIWGNSSVPAFYNLTINQVGATNQTIFTWVGNKTNVTVANLCYVQDGTLVWWVPTWTRPSVH